MAANDDFEQYKTDRPLYEEVARAICEKAKAACVAEGIRCRASSRAKDLHSLVKKVWLKNVPFDEVFDKAGVRIVVEYPEDAERAEKAICEALQIFEYRKDVTEEQDETIFAYRGIHREVGLKKEDAATVSPRAADLHAELQIHKPGESLWATVNHDLLYKSSIKVPKEVRRAVNSLSAVLELVDRGFEEARSKIMRHPEFIEGAMLATLERQFLRLTGKPFDPEISMSVLIALRSVLPKPADVDAFVEKEEDKLSFIYRRYKDDHRHALLFQPESILLWFMNANHGKRELEANWPSEISEDELSRLLSVWA